MKVIISGSTGFIGHEVLMQALTHPSVTSVVALSRKPLPENITKNPKLQTVVLDDFENYTPSSIEQLSGAEACIWTIGAKSTDPATTRKVTVDYTAAAMKAFSKLSPKFRFVFISGFIVVRDQKATLLLYPETRKVAGLAELNLVEFAKKTPGFGSYIARPASVQPKNNGAIMSAVMSLLPSVRVDQLAATLIDLAVHGSDRQTWENGQLARRGKLLLAAQK